MKNNYHFTFHKLTMLDLMSSANFNQGYYTLHINTLISDMREVLTSRKQTCKHIYKP